MHAHCTAAMCLGWDTQILAAPHPPSHTHMDSHPPHACTRGGEGGTGRALPHGDLCCMDWPCLPPQPSGHAAMCTAMLLAPAGAAAAGRGEHEVS